MAKYVLTAIDTTGIQRYIFGSNNLKQIVGASGLVDWATNELVYENLIGIGNSNIEYNKNDLNPTFLKKAIEIEKDNLDCELVYAGGGNTVIIFKEKETAIDFTRKITKEVLLKANGLNLVVSHSEEFEWENNDLAKTIVPNTLKKLNEKKFSRDHSFPLMGLGVTADCQYTGLPAVELRDEKLTKVVEDCKTSVRVSKEVSDKLKFYDSAEKRFEKMFPDVGKKDYEFIHDFSDFGTKNESSYIAVVHADGNGMGKRVQAIANNPQNLSDNRKYIQAIRDFSISVKEATVCALQDTVNQMMETIDYTIAQNGSSNLKLIFEQMTCVDENNKGNTKIRKKLPFRPIIVGGDDITFVCDGRLGLTLAEYYLRIVASKKLSDKEPLSSRAGIAIVKSHYPFSQAASMAEELAASAKKFIRECNKDHLSAMDWHFGTAGSLETIDTIREKNYTISLGSNNKLGKLYMRPVYIGDVQGLGWHSWTNFAKIVNEFKNVEWVKRKNKLNDLREKLLSGPEAVERFMNLYGISGLPEIPKEPLSITTGWIGVECTCFDAIEAFDFFIPLEGGKT